MTQGVTGAYAISGVDFPTQPTDGRWLARPELGIDGMGHPIYAAVREFEIHWGLLYPAEVYALENYFLSAATTGTLVIDLPKYADSTYNFFSYTGCTISEPDFSRYFAEHHTEITLLVHNIRT